jgi:hypothetical protein
MMTNQIPARPHICVLYDGTSNGNSQHRHEDRGAIARALERILALLVKSEGAERRKMSAPDPKRTSPFQRVIETQYDALF